MNKLIVATRNMGKMREFSEILTSMPFEIISMQEAGIGDDIEETGSTFEENALLKASAIHNITGHMVIADDSGLEVDCLDGAPGIYSARFAGEGATDEDKNHKLLSMIEDVPNEKRTARFICAIAVVFPDGTSFTVRGKCEGYIAFKSEGKNGFGYDPLFYIPEYKMTIAQMVPEEKNKISHRGNALKLMLAELENRLK